jgi:prevent-host-death family protein
MNVSIAKARAHLSELVNAAMAGETVVLTRRHRPVAQIKAVVPPEQPEMPEMTAFRCRLGPASDVSAVEISRREER